MTEKEEENADVETLAWSMSTDEEEPSTVVNQSQNSHASQLQKLQEECIALESGLSEQKSWIQEQLLQQQDSHASQLQQLQKTCTDLKSGLVEQKNGMQEQLQQHSNDSEKRRIREECGRMMKEVSKSFIDGERLRVELNQLKISLDSDETLRLDALRADFEKRLDTVSRMFHQQLETVQREFGRQVNELRGQLKTARMLIIGILIVFFATIAVTVDLKSWSSVEQEPPIEEKKSLWFQREYAVKHFMNGANELRGTFPSQSLRLWRIMEAATLPIIEEDNPTHPAVILLVASKGNSAVAECLAGRYAALVTESLNAAEHATFNCEVYADSDPDDAKSQLNTVLTRAFGAGSKSGVVLHLEKLPGPAAMIFYRFAENDNAPFKDVAIVLTLTLESTDTGSERDQVAYDELRKVWGYSLGADKLDPLLSRIGNSVAFVQPETKEVLAGLNC